MHFRFPLHTGRVRCLPYVREGTGHVRRPPQSTPRKEVVVKKKQAVTTTEKTGQYISTLEAAKLCGVSTFSVQRWFDEGLLVGARLPGGKRKIAAESLRRFMQEHGLLPAEGAENNDGHIGKLADAATDLPAVRRNQGA